MTAICPKDDSILDEIQEAKESIIEMESVIKENYKKLQEIPLALLQANQKRQEEMLALALEAAQFKKESAESEELRFSQEESLNDIHVSFLFQPINPSFL